MIEPEAAFYDLDDNMDLAEDFLKYLIRYALDNCMDDLKFLSARQQEEEKNKKAEERSMELIEKLNFVLTHSFERVTYTEAIEILKNSKPNKNGKFQYPVDGWGVDLQSEHERYLVEKHFKKTGDSDRLSQRNQSFLYEAKSGRKNSCSHGCVVPADR